MKKYVTPDISIENAVIGDCISTSGLGEIDDQIFDYESIWGYKSE